MRKLGERHLAPDTRVLGVTLRERAVRTTSALDYWDQLMTLHYGKRPLITDHFREATLSDNWTWAGAPFAAPTAQSQANSVSLVTMVGALRSFMYLPTITTADKYLSLSLGGYSGGLFGGLRLDDGTDNNYFEVRLVVATATPTTWKVQAAQRAGGGAITTADGDEMNIPVAHILRMNLQGTKWSAWGCRPVLHSPIGLSGFMYKPYTDLGAGALNWTPTRVGIVYYAPAQGSGFVYVDWCKF